MDKNNQIVIYKSPDGNSKIEVRLKGETIWLTQRQISELFGTEVPAISKHIKNIYDTGELDIESTLSKMETVQKEGERRVKRRLEHYNLDMIISVGYRVNSKRGTQFRIWANKILREYLLKGYVLNERRLKETSEKLLSLKQTVHLIENVSKSKKLTSEEAHGLLKVVTDYTYALDMLDRYDHQTLEKIKKSSKELYRITYTEAIKAINTLKQKSGGTNLFGKEKDKSLQGSLQNIYQTFDKKELYPALEEKAAHLLYFVVKNHSFVDGNKRIAAFLFIWFLQLNQQLYTEEGLKKIDNKTLVALTLMIATSKPEDKEMMIRVIINLMKKE